MARYGRLPSGSRLRDKVVLALLIIIISVPNSRVRSITQVHNNEYSMNGGMSIQYV